MSLNGEDIEGEYRPKEEEELYHAVKAFFSIGLGCQITGFAVSGDESSLSLNLFGSRISPDVWGLKREDGRTKVIMGEGKKDFKSSNFDICKGQGISRKRFADIVYLFFPYERWNELSSEDQKEILGECESLGFGLLLVNRGETCIDKTDWQVGKSGLTSNIKFDSNRNMEVRFKGVFKNKPSKKMLLLLQLIHELTEIKKDAKFEEILRLIVKKTDPKDKETYSEGTYFKVAKNAIGGVLSYRGLRKNVCQGKLFKKGLVKIKKQDDTILIWGEMDKDEKKRENGRTFKQKLSDSFILTDKGRKKVPYSETPILLDNEKF